MKGKSSRGFHDAPLIYYKTDQDIETYRKTPVKQKFQWLEAQMAFFYKAMPKKAKRIWEKLNACKAGGTRG